MVLFNYSTKELTAKIVYYGAGLCGKTTNLQWIHEQLPIKNKGKMLSLATEADRTLFFDFLPIELGTIRGMKARIQLYTVPGQVFYNATRRMVLKGADCVVFVVDSQEELIEANADAMKNLHENLVANELDPESIPLVIQYNKRDLPNAATLDVLNRAMNPRGVPFIEASAKSGQGVEETLKAATQLVFRVLASKYGNESGGASRSSEVIGRPAAPTPRAPPPLPTPPPPISPKFSSTEELLNSIGGREPAPAPPLLLDDEFDLGPPQAPLVNSEDPFDALSGLATPVPEDIPAPPTGLAIGGLLDRGDSSPSAVGPSEVELDVDLDLPVVPDPGDPFGSDLDSPFNSQPEAGPPAPLPSTLEDPFGSSLEPVSPFGPPPGLPLPPTSGSPLDSILDLGPPGGSTSFTSDPVSLSASVDIPAGAFSADPVHVTVPVEITVSSTGREILIPIRLQLKIRIQ